MVRREKNNYPSIALIQGSLHPSSHTAILLDAAARILSARGVRFTMFDLHTADLDLYDARAVEEYGASTRECIEAIKTSDVILFGVPAYAAQAPGSLKNVVQLASGFLKEKKAGLICFSEKGTAYEASLDFIALLNKAGSHILKPVVLASPDSFRGNAIFDDVVLQLIEELVEAALRT
ncbi:NAD(P)H-dependent oxidoreductase [Candidatus Uhrbacteria bacterium]|nr:NAD(P)H-dependent oxidoreductase [Candidatus Uhrbacteria bacterium]